jgi:hypothetical protein
LELDSFKKVGTSSMLKNKCIFTNKEVHLIQKLIQLGKLTLLHTKHQQKLDNSVKEETLQIKKL